MPRAEGWLEDLFSKDPIPLVSGHLFSHSSEQGAVTHREQLSCGLAEVLQCRKQHRDHKCPLCVALQHEQIEAAGGLRPIAQGKLGFCELLQSAVIYGVSYRFCCWELIGNYCNSQMRWI